MVIKILLLLVALASTISATDLEWFHWKDNDAISFGGFVPEMRAVKAIVGEGDEAPRIVYGGPSWGSLCAGNARGALSRGVEKSSTESGDCRSFCSGYRCR